LKFSILGVMEIEAEGSRAEVQGAFQRTLLVALLVSEGRLVSTESLTYELWGEHPPRNSENALQAHISRLRRKLKTFEPDRPSERLMSSSSGYRLALADEELDAIQFMRTLREVHSQPLMDPDEAARKLRWALSLWQSPAFGGPSGGRICQAAATRYEEARHAVLELLYDYELRVGNHTKIIPELRELNESRSLNERLCEQLMVALYRAGRQTDALAVYRRMWSRLNDELGIEPSPTLQRYERAILAHDPLLLRTADNSRTPSNLALR
jgi:DNA-binding SARP family transcriptional activator